MAYSKAAAKADLKSLVLSTLGGDSAGAENLDDFADAFAEWALNYIATLQATGTVTGNVVVTAGSSAGTYPIVSGVATIPQGNIT